MVLWTRRARDAAADYALAQEAAWRWREACIGAGLCHVVQTVTGPTISTPKILHGHPPAPFVIQLLPGQVLDDVRAAAPRLAGHLGARRLRITHASATQVRMEPVTHEPLGGTLPLAILPGRIWVGRDEYGRDLRITPDELPHVAVQGMTRSGKSGWTYGFVAQALAAGVRIAGVDASGLLLRPFEGTTHARLQACGLADVARVEKVLYQLVLDMDARIATIPRTADRVELGPALPPMLVVLEEWPGVLRALDAVDAKLGKRVRMLVARLLAESHKAGYRVVLIAQRAEANIIGGAERAQCGLRLTFRVDTLDAVRMLHPDAGEDVTGDHSRAPDGVALLSSPGAPTRRMRAPWIGSYGRYAEAVSRLTSV